MKLTVPVIVEAPNDATHYYGSPRDGMNFYKCRSIGVGGDHWFGWSGEKWMMTGHHQPHFIQEIPKEWKHGNA